MGTDFAELRARGERWIEDDPDPETQAELRALLNRPDLASTDAEDRLVESLAFGTAGLRGVLAAGPNRMNRAVVARATWGLATALLHTVPDAGARGVVVGCDARVMSRELSEDVAAILGAAGIRVLLFRSPVPTPLVGFAVKRSAAAAGVVVTASHNPPQYNGYKVFWENAAQIAPPIDTLIAEAIESAPAARHVLRPNLSSLMSTGLVTSADENIENAYVAAVLAGSVHKDRGDRRLRIVYTPLHGVGDRLMRRTLREAGFTDVESVREQQEPDGAFPTVAFPNPEEKGTMDLALGMARESRADIVLANDPDADRLAVAVPLPSPGGAGSQDFRQLTGNEVGVLLGHYLLTEKARDTEGKTHAILSSIVSSPLLGRIATDLGAHYEETLTGFKWIANRAIALEAEGYAFVFGYEEALGYCVGNTVHDKDGISAGLLVTELAAVLRERGQTLVDALGAIARRWGLFASRQISIAHQGSAGVATMGAMMAELRAHPPRDVEGDPVLAVSDYGARVRTRFEANGPTQEPLLLPASDVLVFDLASSARVVLRPSGTEPKVKLYFDVRETVDAAESVASASGRAEAALERLVAGFRKLIRAQTP